MYTDILNLLVRHTLDSNPGSATGSAAPPRSTRLAPSTSSTPWSEGSMVILIPLFAWFVASGGKQVGYKRISELYTVDNGL